MTVLVDEQCIPAPSSGNYNHARTASRLRYHKNNTNRRRTASAERYSNNNGSNTNSNSSTSIPLGTSTSTTTSTTTPYRRRFKGFTALQSTTTTATTAAAAARTRTISTKTKLGMFLFTTVMAYMGLVLYLAPTTTTTTTKRSFPLPPPHMPFIRQQQPQHQPQQPIQREEDPAIPPSLPQDAGKVFRQALNEKAQQIKQQQQQQQAKQELPLQPDSEQLPPPDKTTTTTTKTTTTANAANHLHPQHLFTTTTADIDAAAPMSTDIDLAQHPTPQHVLTAYYERVDYQNWFHVQPLPNRTTAQAEQLTKRTFTRVHSCRHLIQQWPVHDNDNDNDDNKKGCPADADPFLPWIHDVFPSADGRHVHFVAQNRRRCDTGKHDTALLAHRQAQVALFQHVPVKRVYLPTTDKNGNNNHDHDDNQNKTMLRFQLTTHDQADPDAVATRFLCQFSNGHVVPSVFPFDYDWTAFRKRYKGTFFENDGGIKSIHTSQLVFSCPLPTEWHDAVRTGTHVHNDWTTLFVNLVPIRTPPRYGKSTQFLQPRYAEYLERNETLRFDPDKAWGPAHVLPQWKDSGRWENIPICLPSLLQYEQQQQSDDKDKNKWISTSTTQTTPNNNKKETPPDDNPLNVHTQNPRPVKKHRIVSCLWASAGYRTRGERFAINDGQRRLLEWITYHQDVLGFDHTYLYDNSGAFTNETSLKPVADLFPDTVTYIAWPSQICNNRPNNVDSPGERSSQYAAESSCRLRFGPHVDWIGQFDVDEYLVPMGEHSGIHGLLDKWEAEDTRILSFASWRSWPQWSLINPIHPMVGRDLCSDKRPCFDLSVPLEHSILQTYNCDRYLPGKKDKSMPAEKQIYQPSYVYQHFVHYSAVTALSVLNRTEYEAQSGFRYPIRAFPDKRQRFGEETTEALMIHTKAIARQDTAGWEDWCTVENLKRPKNQRGLCRLGIPWPEPWPEDPETATVKGTKDGWAYNCFVNPKVDKEYAPKLQKALQVKVPALGSPGVKND